jgi:Transglutaminase-like superfamily
MSSLHVQKSGYGKLAIAVAMLILASVSGLELRRFGFARARVCNISDPRVIGAPELPGFARQTSNAPGLLQFRKHTAPVVAGTTDDISKVIALLHWVRRQEDDEQFYGKHGVVPQRMIDDTEDPEKYLDEQKKGLRSACRRFAYILTGALLAEGLNARLIALSEGFDLPTSKTHYVVELWAAKLHKWVVVDPTFDAFVLVKGSMASIVEVQAAALSNGTLTLDQHGSKYRLHRMDQYRRYYAHFFVANTNALFDGYQYGLFARKPIAFVHYSGPGIEPFPVGKKRAALVGLSLSLTILSGLCAELLLSFGRFIRKSLSMASTSDMGTSSRTSLSTPCPQREDARYSIC